MNSKFIYTLMILGSLAVLFANAAYADKPHAVVIQEGSTNNYYDQKGIASAISAAQCHFDGGSYDLQLCGSWGSSNSQDAYTVGGGQKFGDFLFNFTVTDENGLISRGGGINWKIKLK